jgi:hypothetical protein
MPYTELAQTIAIVSAFVGGCGVGYLVSPFAKFTFVENKNKHPKADSHYWFVIGSFNGRVRNLLFTEEAIDVAEERARKNPEDLV